MLSIPRGSIHGTAWAGHPKVPLGSLGPSGLSARFEARDDARSDRQRARDSSGHGGPMQSVTIPVRVQGGALNLESPISNTGAADGPQAVIRDARFVIRIHGAVPSKQGQAEIFVIPCCL